MRDTEDAVVEEDGPEGGRGRAGNDEDAGPDVLPEPAGAGGGVEERDCDLGADEEGWKGNAMLLSFALDPPVLLEGPPEASSTSILVSASPLPSVSSELIVALGSTGSFSSLHSLTSSEILSKTSTLD